eukprot:Rhum_TRINITY_DN15307_c20_g1::Rhum_TRINITY_DN15307_c20_g1_i1::g.151995::m.151995
MKVRRRLQARRESSGSSTTAAAAADADAAAAALPPPLKSPADAAAAEVAAVAVQLRSAADEAGVLQALKALRRVVRAGAGDAAAAEMSRSGVGALLAAGCLPPSAPPSPKLCKHIASTALALASLEDQTIVVDFLQATSGHLSAAAASASSVPSPHTVAVLYVLLTCACSGHLWKPDKSTPATAAAAGAGAAGTTTTTAAAAADAAASSPSTAVLTQLRTLQLLPALLQLYRRQLMLGRGEVQQQQQQQ